MHDAHDEDTAPPDVSVGHEVRDISTRVVVVFGVSLAIGAIAVHVVIWLLYLYFGSVADRAGTREYPLARVGAPAEPPAPRLQTRPREELRQMRADEDRFLNSYGWVDTNRGVVHIPIEQAMRLTLEQGLPVRPGATAGPVGRAPERSSSGRTQAPSGRPR
jgi:hypothetical protein